MFHHIFFHWTPMFICMNVFYVSMCVLINLLHQSLIKVAIFPWIHITRAIYNLACILIRIVFDFIISQDLFSFLNCIFSIRRRFLSKCTRENFLNALCWNRTQHITILIRFQLALLKVNGCHRCSWQLWWYEGKFSLSIKRPKSSTRCQNNFNFTPSYY